jgi:LAS superfamily LD-carboxypeptidase LdcB
MGRGGIAISAVAGAALFAAAGSAAAGTYASCGDAPKVYVQAAKKNAQTLDSMAWAPFGLKEKGWETYAPLTAHEIGTTCGFGTPAFAAALAQFQTKYGLEPTGVFDPATFQVLKGVWQERRPFVMARVRDECPDAPPSVALEPLSKDEEAFDREDRSLRGDALKAYRSMIGAARHDLVTARQDSKALAVFSAFRDPVADQERCKEEHNCDGARRAVCSPHRTGTAIDLNLGWAPGRTADSSDPENRLYQTRTALYRWMVANADKYGFVNYVFEPWHWEWIGDQAKGGAAPVPTPPTAALTTMIPAVKSGP